MLFRAEVYQHRPVRSMGRAVPLYAGATLPVVAILMASALGLGIWLATGSYARSERVAGDIVPAGPTARIIATQPGTLVSLAVAEGQHVHAGDRLGVVEIQNATQQAADPAARSLAIVDDQRRQLGEQRRLAHLGTAADRRKLTDASTQLRARLAAVNREVALQRARVESSRRSFAILTTASEKNYISHIDYENQRRAFLDEQARLASLVADRAALQGQLDDNQAALRELPIALGRQDADLDAQNMALAQKRLDIEGRSTIALTAPIDGQVAAVQARVGQSVGPGAPVMYVLGDDAHMEAELYAPSRAIGFAHVGQDVRLMYDAFPYQQFGSYRGTIEAISRTAIPPDEIDAPIKLDSPAFRMRVRLGRQAIAAFGRRYPLQPGMTLSANVILEKQTFLGWLLEPINAVRHRT